MKNWLKKTLLAVTGTGVVLASPILPAEQEERYLSTVDQAIEQRQYLKEREEYYRANNMAQKHIDQAVLSRDMLEQKLVDKGMIARKGDPNHRIRPPRQERQSIIRTISSLNFVERAIAYDFGKEDFESCTTGTLPCSFDTSAGSYGSYTMTIDTGSQVNGEDSLKCVFTSEAACFLETSVSTSSDYYVQYTALLPTGWTMGAAGYTNTFEMSDTSGTQIMYLNIEDYGTNRLILDGPAIAYTNTGLDLPEGSTHKLEVRVKIGTTDGCVEIWLDNNTEGSPDYSSCTLNTGSTDVGNFIAGNLYNPNGSHTMFWDDYMGDTSFIGAGSTSTTPATTDGLLWFN